MSVPERATGMVASCENTAATPGLRVVKPGEPLRRTKGLSADPAKNRAWKQRSKGLNRGNGLSRGTPHSGGDPVDEHRPVVSPSALAAAGERSKASRAPASTGAGSPAAKKTPAATRDVVPIDKTPADKTTGNEIPPASRAEVAARSGGRCEARVVTSCRGDGSDAHHMHHRLLRRHGDHRPINLLHVCHACHTAIHADPDWAYDHGYLVRSWQRPDDIEIRWDLAPSADPRTRRRGTPR